MDNKGFILNIATDRGGEPMTSADLVLVLNQENRTTTRETSYTMGSRGIFKLIHSTYDWLIRQGRNLDAQLIANTFTTTDGNFAYD